MVFGQLPERGNIHVQAFANLPLCIPYLAIHMFRREIDESSRDVDKKGLEWNIPERTLHFCHRGRLPFPTIYLLHNVQL